MTFDTMLKLLGLVLLKLLGLVLVTVSVYRMIEDYKETGMLFRMCYIMPFIVGAVALVV